QSHLRRILVNKFWDIVVILVGRSSIMLVTSILLLSATLSGSVIVNPVANIQNLVNNNPSGITSSLNPGTYVRQSIVPKDGDSFIGVGTVIVTGATTVTGFSFVSSRWVASFKV